MTARVLEPIPRLAWVIPLVAVVLWLALATLWVAGDVATYKSILHYWGIEPFLPPFVDLQNLLGGAQCQHLGIDVFVANPCDILGRRMIYSPLWLSLTPPMSSETATAVGGAVLDLLFFATLPFVLKPRDRLELAVFGVAALSTMVVYALERANADLVVFMLVVMAGSLYRGGAGSRLVAYAGFVLAGLLKFYPFILMLLAAREGWKRVLALAAATLTVALVFLALYRQELHTAFANIPPGEWFYDEFSAQDIPYGLAQLSPALAALGPEFPRFLMLGLIVVAMAVASALALRILVATEDADWETPDAPFLVIGSMLIAGCFLSGSNNDYRGIFFLFALPGLLRLARRRGPLAPMLGATVGCVLFAMWGSWFLRLSGRLFYHAAVEDLDAWPLPRLVYWLAREAVWWWIVTVLIAVVVAFLLRSPLMGELRAALRLNGKVEAR